MAKKIKFIWIGKVKKSFWKQAVDYYWHRLSHFYALEEHCLKEARHHGSEEQTQQKEADSIADIIQAKDHSICIDRRGTVLSSFQLAEQLQKWQNQPNAIPCFLIGGSYGFPRQFLDQCKSTLSFGPMTFPHDLARVILLEQLYRASTILCNHPYHH
jgi:23S rRNA (pseudouridine1915-N3)-methyltransferase